MHHWQKSTTNSNTDKKVVAIDANDIRRQCTLSSKKIGELFEPTEEEKKEQKQNRKVLVMYILVATLAWLTDRFGYGNHGYD